MLKINLSLSSDEPDEYTIMKLRNSLKLMLKNDQTIEAEYFILVKSSRITNFFIGSVIRMSCYFLQ